MGGRLESEGRIRQGTIIPVYIFVYNLIFLTMSIYYFDLIMFNYQKI